MVVHHISTIVITLGLLHATNAGQFYYDLPVPNNMSSLFNGDGEAWLCTMFEIQHEELYIQNLTNFGDVENINHLLLHKGKFSNHDSGDTYECINGGINAPPEAGGQDWEILGGVVYNKNNFLNFGEGVGREIGTKSGFKYIRMQMHFKYPLHEDRYYGLRLNVTDEKPELLGHFMSIGCDDNNSIPPHSTKNIDTIFEITEDINANLTHYYWHNHLYGMVGSIWLVRDMSEWTLITKDNPQYKLPNFKPLPEPYVTVKKGDYIALRAVFQSDSDEVTTFGKDAGQESLKFFFMYTTTGHEGFKWKAYRDITWADMFTNVPEIEANTLYGEYYEPCVGCYGNNDVVKYF